MDRHRQNDIDALELLGRFPAREDGSSGGEGVSVDGGLLDRKAELAEIDCLLDRTCSGAGGLLIIEGQAGLGKTTLLSAAHERATAKGMRVLSGRAGQLEADLPFGVVRQLLEPVVRADGDPDLLAGASRLAAPVLQGGASPAALNMDPVSSICHGLYWLVVNLCQRSPVLLSADDAHWADPASARFLDYLVRRIEGLPLLVAVAGRQAEPGAPPTPVAALAGHANARVLRPRPLSEAATALVVREWLGAGAEEPFCRACRMVTGGNPFLLRALCAELAAEGFAGTAAEESRVRELGPATVSSSVLLRLAQMGPSAVAVARAVAVLGQGAQFRFVVQLAGVGEAEAVDTIAALARAGIVDDTRPMQFAHSIVAASIYNDLTLSQRAHLHASAARLLRDGGGDVDGIAAHLLLSDPAGDPWVVELLRRAAERALGRGAPDAAVRYLRRALAEPPGPGAVASVLLNLGHAEALLQDPGAIGHLRQAVHDESNPLIRARAGRLLGRLLAFSGEAPEAVSVLDQAKADADTADPALALAIETDLIDAARFDIRTVGLAIERAGHLRAQMSTTSTEPTSPAERLALVTLALDAGSRGESADVCADLCVRALADGRLLAEETADSQRVTVVAFILIDAERLELADELIDATLSEANGRGSVFGYAHALIARAWASYARGALNEAETDIRSAFDASASLNAGPSGAPALVPQMAVIAHTAHLAVLAERGDAEGAEPVLRAAFANVPANLFMLSFLLLRRGQLRKLQGLLREALDDFLEAGRLQRAYRFQNLPFLPWRSDAALACAALGDRAEAERLGEEAVLQARAWGAPWALGMALRALGLVRGDEHGIGLLRESVAVLECSEARLEYARALVELGAALRRMHQPAAARPPLRQGLDLAERCDATVLAQRAADELAVAGAKPRRRRLTGPTSLTVSEQRIVDLAVEGMTNPQIAQSLFVTLRTVEMHLSNAYRKLGIASRTELSQALAGDGR